MPYMQRALLGFCAGALLLGLPWPGGPGLPGMLVPVCVAGLLGVCGVAAWQRAGRTRWLPWVGLLLGLGWSALAHDAALQARVGGAGSPAAVTLTVRVLEVSVDAGSGPAQPPVARFQAHVLDATGGAGPALAGATVRLSWYGAPALQPGSQWRLRARVKGPWGYANPGGFDYERWLLGRGIHATGWVRRGEPLSTAAPDRLALARDALAAHVAAAELARPGVLLALLVGRSDGIDAELWGVLRATGTVHLMVISGLHVSLATALGFLAGRGLCRICPLLPLWLDARRVGCLFGAAAALAYVALAGAGLPALRALVMGTAVLVLLAGGRRGRADGLLLLALAVLLVVEPLAVHQQGFWLSFAAVGLLLITLGVRSAGRIRRSGLLRAQLALSLGMLPLLALLTGTMPWLALPANLLAVPLMSACVVPATLLAGLLVGVWPAAADLALAAADAVLAVLLAWLETLAAAAPAPRVGSGSAALLLAQAAALWWLLGAPRQHWPALLLCLTAPLLPRATGLLHGEYRVTALDVGQGTAVSVDTRRHRLLYDAGPGFPGGFETGSAVVVPSIVATGPAQLDTLVLSHGDVDHVGGASAVAAALTPRRILVGGPLGAAVAIREAGGGTSLLPCHGESWTWDGVRFRLLDVERPVAASDNDRSCVLLVDDGRHRTLIAGDIGARVEARLLRRLAGGPALALMFAPHHGSRTSSSRALVRVARPRLVFVSAGRGNRFGHPHGEVVARYRRAGAHLHRTGRDGALVWRSGAAAAVLRWRRDRAPYWRAGSAGT